MGNNDVIKIDENQKRSPNILHTGANMMSKYNLVPLFYSGPARNYSNKSVHVLTKLGNSTLHSGGKMGSG